MLNPIKSTEKVLNLCDMEKLWPLLEARPSFFLAVILTGAKKSHVSDLIGTKTIAR